MIELLSSYDTCEFLAQLIDQEYMVTMLRTALGLVRVTAVKTNIFATGHQAESHCLGEAVSLLREKMIEGGNTLFFQSVPGESDDACSADTPPSTHFSAHLNRSMPATGESSTWGGKRMHHES